MKFSGILHVHSDYSYDGEVSLAELRARCEHIGVQFVCFTEHTENLSEERTRAFIQECRERSDATFLFIPGFEVPHANVHILKLGDTLSVIAHPHRSKFAFERSVYEQCIGAEIWNSQYDGKRFPRWTALRWFRAVARSHPEFRALAGIDLHRPSHLGGPQLRVSASALTEEHILGAIRNGDYRLVSRWCALDAQGRLFRPHPALALMGSMLDVGLVRCARLVSTAAKHLGLHRLPWFRRIREYLRTKF